MPRTTLSTAATFAAALALSLTACQQKREAPAGTAAAPGAATAAGAATSADDSTPLAKVGDVVITVGDFQDQLNRQSPYIRARYTSLEQKKEFLDNLIRFEVLAAEATRRGFDRDPEVVRTMKSVMVQKLMRAEFDRVLPLESITDAEMKTYYDANTAEYVKPEEIRASAIVVKDRAQAEKIAAEAQGEAGKTNKGFRELVQKYSTDDATKARGGDLRYFPRAHKELLAPVVAGAFALTAIGQVSGAIDGGDGTWWVLKQTGRRNAITKTFEDVKPQLRSKLHREKRLAMQDSFVDTLRGQAKVEVDEANLAKVKVDTSNNLADPHDHGAPPAPDPAAAIPPAPGAAPVQP